ncbi:MAG: hypothetical protein OXN21_08520 [Chloroflexota bacterium]|nr:hypothetical protein [Chloroflexota bacterium]
MSYRGDPKALYRLSTLFCALKDDLWQDEPDWEESYDIKSFVRVAEDMLALGEDLDATASLLGGLVDGALKRHLENWEESLDGEQLRQRKMDAQARVKEHPLYNLDMSDFPRDNMLHYNLVQENAAETRARLHEVLSR